MVLDGAVTYNELRDLPLTELFVVEKEAVRILEARKQAARQSRQRSRARR